ncbi:hypothetical protein PAXINDRAFT_9308 [Paxillus involutus ATCC 200175]|nr:hypothetical protein PAXINDRAFT_9308 [Paxillus involutus ATCC 200175]
MSSQANKKPRLNVLLDDMLIWAANDENKTNGLTSSSDSDNNFGSDMLGRASHGGHNHDVVVDSDELDEDTTESRSKTPTRIPTPPSLSLSPALFPPFVLSVSPEYTWSTYACLDTTQLRLDPLASGFSTSPPGFNPRTSRSLRISRSASLLLWS